MRVINPQILPDLGCTEYVFFDKTGTLLTTDYELITVSSTSKIYQSHQSNFLNPDLCNEINRINTVNNRLNTVENKEENELNGENRAPLGSDDMEISERIGNMGIRNTR